MRALLTPEIAPRMGIVLFRPGSELMPLFMQGRVLLEPEPERYSSFVSGAVPAASQPLADDPAVRAVFLNEAVIRRAGGVECLESWLLREKGCQWPHSDWHSENMTTMRHTPGAIRLCWHCDNQLRDQYTERLESMAIDNCARWVLSVVRRDLGFDENHVVTLSAAQPGDVLLCCFGSSVPNHAAIYCGNGELLHHIPEQLSKRERYSDKWQRRTHSLWRHRAWHASAFTGICNDLAAASICV